MIVRLWHARARPDKAEAYVTHAEESVRPFLHNIDGFISGQLLTRPLGDKTEIVAITYWNSLEAVSLFGDGDPGLVLETDAMKALLDDWDPRAKIYEAALSDTVWRGHAAEDLAP